MSLSILADADAGSVGHESSFPTILTGHLLPMSIDFRSVTEHALAGVALNEQQCSHCRQTVGISNRASHALVCVATVITDGKPQGMMTDG